MTEWEFNHKQQGYHKKTLDSWKQTRQLAFIIYKSNSTDTQGITIEQFWPLEEVKKTPSITRKRNFKSLIEKYRWRQTQP